MEALGCAVVAPSKHEAVRSSLQNRATGPAACGGAFLLCGTGLAAGGEGGMASKMPLGL